MTPQPLCLVATSDQRLAADFARHLEAAELQVEATAPGYALLEAVALRRPQAIIIDADTFGGLLTEVMQALRLDPATEVLPIIAVQSLVAPHDREHARSLRLDGIHVRSPLATATAVAQIARVINGLTRTA